MMSTDVERLLAAGLACAITVAIFAPYLLAEWRRTSRPAAVSWVIWVPTLLAAGGQLLAGAGIGALPILLSGLLSSAAALLTMLRTRARSLAVARSSSDGWCLALVLGCIPVWLATGDERWSMILLTAIDLVGFAPTVRSTWRRPHAGSALVFAALALRNAGTVAALDAVNLSTVVFPSVIGAACLGMALLVVVRRRQIAPSAR